MASMLYVVFAMSILSAIWEPPASSPAETAPPIKGWKNRVEVEMSAVRARSRSPRRKQGVKAFLKQWAQGETSAVAMYRICNAIINEDGSDCGRGMNRIANLASLTGGSEKNCSKKLASLLAETALPKLITPIPHEKGEKTITHHLRPTDLIRLIHRQNRSKFGQIFGAIQSSIRDFWASLFASDDGREFKNLHPTLRNKDPEQLQTSIPIVAHEDAAPYGKKRSVNVLQWGPLIVRSNDIESRFVHHGYISKQGEQGEQAETARRAWGKFWDEIDLLADGYHEDGLPIARDEDGTLWKFVFLFTENDFDMDVEHGTPNYKRVDKFCKHCRCTNISSKKTLEPDETLTKTAVFAPKSVVPGWG